ncbi:MAG TPA: YlzJ-like family protein [Massilibacterium sp.]|mgnify:CR=1 FL=1|nr:YlzJ-like family protein [Massilibacterium sp.]
MEEMILMQNHYWNQTNESKKEKMYVWKQRPVLCVEKKGGKLEVIQLLSTDPADFLIADFQPGKEISLYSQGTFFH